MTKIFGGLLKGLKLEGSSKAILRPTQIQLKRKVFDAHQDLAGCLFVDFFAGTGSMGLEAWSRGAKGLYLLETNKDLINQLNKYKKKIEENWSNEVLERPISIIKTSTINWVKKNSLKKFQINSASRIIYFIDPPYEIHEYYRHLLDKIRSNWDNCYEIWIESDTIKGIDENFIVERGFRVLKTYSHSNSFISLCTLK